MAKEKEEKELTVPIPKTLVLEGDPEKQLEFAHKAAKALMKVVESKPKKVIINGKQYLEYGSWQTLARFFGATAGVDWTKPITDAKGAVVGYEARAIVYQHGTVISSAEASCLRTERNWANRDEFALKSMAQTRAAAKALRNAFGWVAELAGYASTPAEEMVIEKYDTTPIKAKAKVTVTEDKHEYMNEDDPREYGDAGDAAEYVTIPLTPESPPKDPTPWRNPKVPALMRVDEKKKLIADMLNKIALVPLTTKEEYETICEAQTGLRLVTANYDKIISKLKAL